MEKNNSVQTVSFIALLLFTSNAFALQKGPDDVLVRVIDCRQALCCVAEMSGEQYMVYDAGDYSGQGQQVFDAIQEIIPPQSEIEFLVLSHSDSNHLQGTHK